MSEQHTQQQTNDQYIVAWMSRLTGAEGRGVQAMPREQAEEWVERANREHPDLLHWAVCAPETSS